MVGVMRWLKGVVQATSDNNVLIELENGRREWATPPFKLSIREHVLVSWDYTNARIGTITTSERWAHTETIRDIMEEKSMIDVFQSPMGEPFEDEADDPAETSNTFEVSDRDSEGSMVEVFRVPLGEDVGCDDAVDLRHDIKR
jgi:hypothetical protein